MLAKAMIFKSLETLMEYEFDKKYFLKMPKYLACSKLEKLIYKKIDKKIALYTGCANVLQARYFAREFILFFMDNYQLIPQEKKLVKLAKKILKKKKLSEDENLLLQKNKKDFHCLYFLKEGDGYKQRQNYEQDLALFMQKYFMN